MGPRETMSLLDFVKTREGCEHRRRDGTVIAYWDPFGKCFTIGYGSTGPHVTPGLVWTQAQCEADLSRRLDQARAQLLALSPDVEWPEGAQDALTDFVYNVGAGHYRTSQVRQHVEEGDWDGVRAHLLDWESAGGKRLAGLVARREGEAAMIESPLVA